MKEIACLFTGVGVGFILGVTFYEKVLLRPERNCKQGRSSLHKVKLSDEEQLAADFYAGVGKTSNSYSNIF
jgi:hypothetical protein